MVSRAQRTAFGEWWWTVDRLLLGGLIALMVIGVILALASSPAIAMRLGIDMFHFVNRQLIFLIPSVCALVLISFFTPRDVRRLAFFLLVFSWLMVIATLLIGANVNGARRWISFAGLTMQPSELLKPSFVVITAWLFSESVKRNDIPARLYATLLLIVCVIPLIRQPDIGQTMLICAVWAAMLFLSGLRMWWVGGLIGSLLGGLTLAYTFLPHVRKRFSEFLAKSDDVTGTSQIDKAMQAMSSGGWFGKGPGEGLTKRSLPDSHTDFIAAVAAEEFGIILLLVILALFAFIVLRSLKTAMRDEDPFCRFAITGLAMLFGLQASINLMVNLQMIPAKGMTLPFISYGGSSLISLSIGMGMLLALTRKRPGSGT
jgi:cell division protein FtsW